MIIKAFCQECKVVNTLYSTSGKKVKVSPLPNNGIAFECFQIPYIQTFKQQCLKVVKDLDTSQKERLEKFVLRRWESSVIATEPPREEFFGFSITKDKKLEIVTQDNCDNYLIRTTVTNDGISLDLFQVSL